MLIPLEFERELVPLPARSPLYPPIPDADKPAVLRTASFAQPTPSKPILTFSDHKHSPIRHLLQHPFPSPPLADLGAMRALPVELTWHILLLLDIPTLLHFRQLNRRARVVSTALPAYRLAATHALPALLGLFRMSTAPAAAAAPISLTLPDLRAALGTGRCASCGDFAPFLVLGTLTRRCARCLDALNTQADSWGEPRTRFRMDPALYAPNPLRPGPAERLRSIRPVAGLLRMAPEDWFLPTVGVPVVVDFGEGGRVEREGVGCRGCEVAVARFAGEIGVVEAEWVMQRCFGREGFLVHFRWCREAQVLWEGRGGGGGGEEGDIL